jgi:exonuclease SbcC
MADARHRLESALHGLPDVEALEQRSAGAREAAAHAAGALAQATATRRAAEQTAQDAALVLTKTEADLAGAGREFDLRQRALDAALRDRDETLSLLRGRFGPDIPADAGMQLETMRTDLGRAEHEEQAARIALDAALKALRGADEDAGKAAARLTELDLRLGELRARAENTLENLDRLDAQLKLGDLPVPDAARDIRTSTLAEWCRTAATILQDHSSALHMQAQEAAAAIVVLASALESAPTDAQAALEALESAERLAVSSRVRADETRRRLADRVTQREELEAGLADDDKQIAVLSVLARELRADHFIEFVLQETLDLLAEHASRELLRISGDRYSLVSENGEFSVVDHVNADERRSVKTLSGGETFMASLSLALALSKHVTELAGEGLGARLDAVFIDEGFGSLDPETLEEVIDALERLREDDLLVGVISHVPALAERISAGLSVSKDGNRSLVLPRT